MKKESIKIGVMGCANIAQRSVIPAILTHPSFELIAIASRDQSKANQFASQFNCTAIEGYDNLLSQDIDAVYMPLPTGLHEEWVMKCLEAGKHVYVEKSFAMNFSSAQKMLALAREKKLIVMENFMFPYHSQHAFLTNLLNNGSIGEIRSFRANFGFPPLSKSNFRYDLELGGGALLDAAAYTVKVSNVILGENYQFLSSTIGVEKESGVDISGSAHLIYDEQIAVQLAWGFSHFYQCGVEIWGSKGKITTNRTFTAAVGFQPSLKLETQGEVREFLLPVDNHFHNILSVLAQNIINNKYVETSQEVEAQSRLLNIVNEKALRYELRK